MGKMFVEYWAIIIICLGSDRYPQWNFTFRLVCFPSNSIIVGWSFDALSKQGILSVFHRTASFHEKTPSHAVCLSKYAFIKRCSSVERLSGHSEADERILQWKCSRHGLNNSHRPIIFPTRPWENLSIHIESLEALRTRSTPLCDAAKYD